MTLDIQCHAHAPNRISRLAADCVRDKGYCALKIYCATGEQLCLLYSELQRRFANGRGHITAPNMPIGLPGYAHFVIDHTDIGSDSENDGQIVD